MFDRARLIVIMCNFIAIIYSVYISMVIYEVIDSVMGADAYRRPFPIYFRGDSMQLRNTIYERLYIIYEEEEQDGDKSEHREEHEEKIDTVVYSPFNVCYVNSYRVFDSNSTLFDYSKETEYDIQDYESLLGDSFNKMYVVIDDIHMVFSIKNQQCIKYPYIIEKDN